MPLPILPIALAGLVGGIYLKEKGKPQMTDEQRRIYDAALQDLRDPEKLRTLAKAFDEQGFREEADLLYKRAQLKDLPKDVIAARKEIYRKAMQSLNKDAVLKIAEAFEQEGATSAAANLRKHAEQITAPPTEEVKQDGNVAADASG